MRIEELVSPANDAELFDLEPEALLLKPYMTGDVFVDVDTGAEEQEAVMIIGHPCVIRGSRGKLARRVPCSIVKQMDTALPYAEWPERKWDKLPLPDSAGLGSHSAGAMLEWRSIPHSSLQRTRRRVTMTERGAYVLQQRFTHALTRCAVPVSDFERSSRHVMREAELEYEWVADLATDADAGQIATLVADFHEFLDQDDRRALIQTEGGDSKLRSVVRNEIKARRASRTGD